MSLLGLAKKKMVNRTWIRVRCLSVSRWSGLTAGKVYDAQIMDINQSKNGWVDVRLYGTGNSKVTLYVTVFNKKGLSRPRYRFVI